MFQTWTRYKSHTSPHDLEGIQVLQRAYQASEIYEYQAGRVLPEGNAYTDFVLEGAKKLPNAIDRWIKGRTFRRSTEEDWSVEDPMDTD